MQSLTDIMKQLNIDNAQAKATILYRYMEGILDWNEKVNLTAITDREEFVRKHYIDSLLCVDADVFREARTVIDVGTGGGFPGVPLAVCYPEKDFVLMDSLAKRLRIVDELCLKLGIKNVKTLHGRAEELARQKGIRDTFDLCVSRAVANMSTLSEYCLPFVKAGGHFVAYKGPDCEKEVNNASKAIKLLGGKLEKTVNVSESDVFSEEGVFSEFDHNLVYVKKTSATPKAYPRQAGTPAGEPL